MRSTTTNTLFWFGTFDTNVWETAFQIEDSSADNDGDGVKNWQEYQAGTIATNLFSVLNIQLTAIPGAATLNFEAISNHTYMVCNVRSHPNSP